MTLGLSTTMLLARSGCCPACRTSPAIIQSRVTRCCTSACRSELNLSLQHDQGCCPCCCMPSSWRYCRRQNSHYVHAAVRTTWLLQHYRKQSKSGSPLMYHLHCPNWPGHLMSSTGSQSHPPGQHLLPCIANAPYLQGRLARDSAYLLQEHSDSCTLTNGHLKTGHCKKWKDSQDPEGLEGFSTLILSVPVVPTLMLQHTPTVCLCKIRIIREQYV